MEKTKVVDLVSIDVDAGECHLIIVDNLEWDDEHLFTLQERINTYLRIIESGEVFVTFPNSRGLEVVIVAMFKYRPSDKAMAFCAQAREILLESGFDFRFGPSEAGYSDDTA